ncbi:hypothetical protein MMC28_003817 [Mycoblastus sanguinarius]|nr:hypothetical protein [Mycoblastus sanguinarius]
MHLHQILTLLTFLFLSRVTPAISPTVIHHPIAASASSGHTQDLCTLEYRTPHKRALAIQGLPKGWSGVFQDFVSVIQRFNSVRPSTPLAATFVRFFNSAAAQAILDTVAGRLYQRFIFGALVMEMITEEGLVTKEFVEAAMIWLLNAAQRGWIGLFKAWVTDIVYGGTIFIQMGTIWDIASPS